MRHLTTLLLCILPALALGQSAVTVRGPSGAAGAAAPGTTPTFTVTETPELAWVANDGFFEASGDGADQFATSGTAFAVKAPGGLTCARLSQSVSASYFTAGTDLGWPASHTVMTVVRIEDDTTPRWLFGAAPSSGLSQHLWGSLHVRSGGILRYTFGDGTDFSQGDTAAGVVTLGQWHVITLRYTDTSNQAEVWVDGVSRAITTVSTAATSAGGDGASDYSFGRVGEVTSNYAVMSICAHYVWTSSISNADRAAGEGAWMTAMGL